MYFFFKNIGCIIRFGHVVMPPFQMMCLFDVLWCMKPIILAHLSGEILSSLIQFPFCSAFNNKPCHKAAEIWM